MFKYLYIVNYPKEEKELFMKEMAIFFGNQYHYPYFFSNVDIDENRSLYLKYKLQIDYQDSSLEALVNTMWKDQYKKNHYRVYYLQINQIKTHFEDRIKAMKDVGNRIVGDYDFENPIDKVGVIKIDEVYYVGKLSTSDPLWDRYLNKPHSYSQSLPIRVSKSLINLVVGNNQNMKIVDGCCGVGTVVLEGLNMNVDIIGVEMNRLIANQAKENLLYYGYDPNRIIHHDFLEIKEQCDGCILDLPYGILSTINEEEIMALIKKAYQISNKLILVSTIDLNKSLIKIGYQKIERLEVKKQTFKRYIHLCYK